MLFTDINVGTPGAHALQSGGPEASGPNTLGWTTFWNVHTSSGAAMPPPGSNTAKQGSCDFGPDILFVGTRLAGRFCPSWAYFPDVTSPPNLYEAQLARRRGAVRPTQQTLIPRPVQPTT